MEIFRRFWKDVTTIPLTPKSNTWIGDVLYWMNNHWEVPLISVVLYTVVVLNFIPWCMQDKRPIKPKGLIMLWNFSLSFFSGLGFCYVIPEFLYGDEVGMISQGYYASICAPANPTYLQLGHGSWVLFFILSKIPELMDTVWLTLAKIKPIFLHWYHHITVLIYCWHAYCTFIEIGPHFCVMNYFVHFIMYFYYGCTQWSISLKLKIRPYACYITILQLSQMGFGLLFSLSSLYYSHYLKMPCHNHLGNIKLSLLMYASYFILFYQLFITKSLQRKKKTKEKILKFYHCFKKQNNTKEFYSQQQKIS